MNSENNNLNSYKEKTININEINNLNNNINNSIYSTIKKIILIICL